ncbi:MAG: hypothetical protein WBA23_16920 [Tunicatimonas sp.]|uniref:hypothetical protein n=1 Tax=Tunicatimonas sp. TaxID=1940096 RepID=UPI003C71C02A
MQKLTANLTTLVSLVILFSGCEHICDCKDDDPDPCAFSYESVVYTPDGAPGDQLVSPMFDSEMPEGSFSVTPSGLAIDTETGVIDVNASEYGKEYVVKFRIKESEVVCETNIFIDEPKVETCDLNYETQVVFPGEKEFLAPLFASGYVPDGNFSAYPSGLDISPEKGIVNIKTSTSGVQYFITYISKDKKTICQTTLLITGVDYPERIINFDKEESILSPEFNEPDDSRLTFGSYEASPSELVFVENQQGQLDGSINIRETVIAIQDQEFQGEQLPEGFARDYTINYVLFDDNETTSSLELRLYYYSSLEAVRELAPELLEAIEDRGQSADNGRIEKNPRYVIAIGDAR